MSTSHTVKRVACAAASAAFQVAALHNVFVSATLFLDEPFGAGWAAGPRGFLAMGNYLPAAQYETTEVPNNVLRLQNTGTSLFSALEYLISQPTAYGIDVNFTQSQWQNYALYSAGADGAYQASPPLSKLCRLGLASCGCVTARRNVNTVCDSPSIAGITFYMRNGNALSSSATLGRPGGR